MLSPYCEREAAEKIITDIGLDSLDRWPGLLERLVRPVFYREHGSLVVAHAGDRDELERLRRRVLDRNLRPDAMKDLRGADIRELEPELSDKFNFGLYFPFERHIDNRDLMAALLERAGNAGLIPPTLAKQCGDAYRHYRYLQHTMRMQNIAKPRVAPESVAQHVQAVNQLYEIVLGKNNF